MAEPAIMFVTRKWAPAKGGMETYCLRLTEAIARQQPVQTVALAGRANGMPPSALALLLFPFTVLARVLRRTTRPEVAHLGDLAIWPLGLFFSAKTRLVISAHGTDVSYPRRGGLLGTAYGAYLRLGAKLLARAKVIANSQATAAALRESGWQAEAIVPLATDLAAPERTAPRHDTVLFVGRLKKLKGCGWFIREVLPRLPEGLTFAIAGTKWDAEESALTDHPRVKFLGAQDKQSLCELYSSALCVVVPNIALPTGEFEGFGLVAPEAASCGGVVLAADNGGLADAVQEGKTGFLLESGNAQAWADKIAEVAGWDDARRAAFTASAQQQARDFYNWDRVAQQTLAVYQA